MQKCIRLNFKIYCVQYYMCRHKGYIVNASVAAKPIHGRRQLRPPWRNPEKSALYKIMEAHGSTASPTVTTHSVKNIMSSTASSMDSSAHIYLSAVTIK